MCLRLYVFTDELTTCWIKGDLARSVDKLATADSLVVGANSCGGMVCQVSACKFFRAESKGQLHLRCRLEAIDWLLLQCFHDNLFNCKWNCGIKLSQIGRACRCMLHSDRDRRWTNKRRTPGQHFK